MFKAKKLSSPEVALVRKELGYSVRRSNKMLTDETFNVFGIMRQGGTMKPAVLVPVTDSGSSEATMHDFRTLEDLTTPEIEAALQSLVTYYQSNKLLLDPAKLIAREEYELLHVLTLGREKDANGVYRITAARSGGGRSKDKQQSSGQSASRFL